MKGLHGPTLHSRDTVILTDTLALMTHTKIEKNPKQPLQNREMLTEKQTFRS